MSVEWRAGQQLSDEELEELYQRERAEELPIGNVLCWQNVIACLTLWGMIIGVAYLFWWKAGQ